MLIKGLLCKQAYLIYDVQKEKKKSLHCYGFKHKLAFFSIPELKFEDHHKLTLLQTMLQFKMPLCSGMHWNAEQSFPYFTVMSY